MKHIGFTGTRHGMTPEQYCKVIEIVGTRPQHEWVAHHGDCIGADADFHRIATGTCAMTVGHVPSDDSKRAFCSFHDERQPRPYLERNKDIVNESDAMVACPQEQVEVSRGGTWATVRYARKVGKPLAVVFPDGAVRYERWGTMWPETERGEEGL